MTDDPMIYKEVLEPYFQSMSHSDERYSVKVELSSDENRVTFKVQFEILEPGFTASFPQQEYILEKHRGRGHEGIHFQTQAVSIPRNRCCEHSNRAKPRK